VVSDDNTSAIVYWIAAIAILFVVILALGKCQEARKDECRARGGRVAEQHGELLKWICIEPERRTP
jgi:hypothetical protein